MRDFGREIYEFPRPYIHTYIFLYLYTHIYTEMFVQLGQKQLDSIRAVQDHLILVLYHNLSHLNGMR
jgi:hypothetical protein